jgi:hypothetical protein
MDGFQEIRVTRDAAAIFGRTLTLAAHTDQAENAGFRQAYSFTNGHDLPSAAKVIGIHGLGTGFA